MRTARLLTESRCIPCILGGLPPLDADPHPWRQPPLDAEPWSCGLWYILQSQKRMTDACENITLPQTLFAGGNKN